jgi:hypothetical protein
MKKLFYTLTIGLLLSSCSSINQTTYTEDSYFTPDDIVAVEVEETESTESNAYPPSTVGDDYTEYTANRNAVNSYDNGSNWDNSIQDEGNSVTTSQGNTVINNNYYDYSGSYAYRFSQFGTGFYPGVYYRRGRRYSSFIDYRPRVYLGWNNRTGWNVGIGFGNPYFGGFYSPYSSFGYNPYCPPNFYGGNWGYNNWGYNNWGFNNFGYGYNPYNYYGNNYNFGYGGSSGGSNNNATRLRRNSLGSTTPTRQTSSNNLNKPLGMQTVNGNIRGTGTTTNSGTRTSTTTTGTRGDNFDYKSYTASKNKTRTSTTTTGSSGNNSTTTTSGKSTRTTYGNKSTTTSGGSSTRSGSSTRKRTTTTTTTTRRKSSSSSSGYRSSGSRSSSSGTRTSSGSTRKRSSGSSSSGTRRKR